MGAWGTEPFENDSACDWIIGIRDQVEKGLYYVRHEGKYGRTGQHEALAAVVLVRQVPEIARCFTVKSGYTVTFAEEALGSLLILRKDEQFIASWRSPAKYLKVVDRELRAVRRIVAVQRKEKRERLQKLVRQIKRIPKKERDRMVRRGVGCVFFLYNSSYREAFKIADGRDLPESKPIRRRRIRTRRHK